MFIEVPYYESPVAVRNAIEDNSYFKFSNPGSHKDLIYTYIYVPNILHYHRDREHLGVKSENGAAFDVVRILLVGEVSVYTFIPLETIRQRIKDAMKEKTITLSAGEG